MPPPKKVAFLYSGSQQSLRSQYNAFKRALPRGINLIPHLVNNAYQKLLPGAQGLLMNNVDVLVAAGGPVSARAAQQATAAQPPGTRTPVVFTSVTDPVGSGLYVAGGNLTGIAGMTTEMDAARLRLLQELVPGINTVGVLINPNRPNVAAEWNNLMQGKDPNLNLVRGDAVTGTIPQVIQNLAPRVQALLVTADPLFNDQRAVVIATVGPLNIPAIYQWREFVDNGGLMSFGPNLVEEYVAAAKYVVRILNGEQPANIPLYQPTTFELVINGGTAMALRRKIPPSLRARAHVIKPTVKPPRRTTVKRPRRK
jgi:putative tryptophan/tyrosine transport system substrate-binding protein